MTPNVDGLATGGTLSLNFKNKGDDPMQFTGGLHPYRAFSDATAVIFNDLEEHPVEDFYQPSLTALPSSWQPVDGQAVGVLVCGFPALLLQDGARSIQLTASGFAPWMIWNPGRELASGLRDMPADDWQRFDCIEPVGVKQPVVLQAGQSKQFDLTWQIL